MEFNFVQWALLFSLIILLELSLGFYGLQRLIRRLEPVSRKVEDFFLIYTFKQVVNFVSENDLVQQGLLGSLVAMGDKEFLDYMRSKIGDMKLQIEKIGNGISRFENARRSISRIFSLSPIKSK
ncbi:hypothetical protein [Metallosphaera hakonensis]|uniref:DUF1512 domain-containing protein n=1 Tax=Metallosphaera hakonensis JCM 8857 = DSM 7519 TaxID=1293036 RepID=A0A2U9IVW2_9CREN|nr:hypothetical protein [Metallosphaera hakonensis]AWS00103.1 hypothetical protein DFR87_10885 [Metallosphaera hakonensis JCM 8857 = DSM 7519]